MRTVLIATALAGVVHVVSGCPGPGGRGQAAQQPAASSPQNPPADARAHPVCRCTHFDPAENGRSAATKGCPPSSKVYVIAQKTY